MDVSPRVALVARITRKRRSSAALQNARADHRCSTFCPACHQRRTRQTGAWIAASVQRSILDPLSQEILAIRFRKGDSITAGAVEGKIAFVK